VVISASTIFLVRQKAWRSAGNQPVPRFFFPSASEAIMYVLMAVVLLIRPRGLLGEEGMMT
jgi:branched-subunit amino acid ABC-type transport system permease component